MCVAFVSSSVAVFACSSSSGTGFNGNGNSSGNGNGTDASSSGTDSGAATTNPPEGGSGSTMGTCTQGDSLGAHRRLLRELRRDELRLDAPGLHDRLRGLRDEPDCRM